MIRSFQNADLPVLHRLWMEHWSAIGPPPAVREAQLEQAVLSRTFFRADELLVAEIDGVPVGWLHFCTSPQVSDLVSIPAICLGVGAEASTASMLLREARDRCVASGASRIRVGVVRDDQFGYAGLDPIGHGTGISMADDRMNAALESEGYQVTQRSVAMTVSVAGFRPPVSREGLQFRRSTRLETEPFCYQSTRHAAGMSHLDVETNLLVDRTGQSLAAVNLWFSDAEAEVMNPSLMILDINEALARGSLDSAEAYLVAASIQSTAYRKILSVETSIDEDHTEILCQLEALQFRPASRGVCWERQLQ